MRKQSSALVGNQHSSSTNSFYWLLSFQVLTSSRVGHPKHPCLAPVTNLQAQRISSPSYSKDLVRGTCEQHLKEPQYLKAKKEALRPIISLYLSTAFKIYQIVESHPCSFCLGDPFLDFKSDTIFHFGWYYYKFAHALKSGNKNLILPCIVRTKTRGSQGCHVPRRAASPLTLP